MLSKGNLLIAILFALSVYGLFQIKYKVLELKRETRELVFQLDAEKRELESLKVEWTYLTNPQRLAMLASKYLNLSKTNVERISEVKDVKLYKVSDQKKKAKILNVAFKKQNGSWRYRRDIHAVGKSKNLKPRENKNE
jgi:cell division protein FtsL